MCMFLSWVRGLSSLFTGRAVLPTGIAATKGKSLRTQQRGNTVIAADALVRHEQKTYSISIRLVVVPGWDDLSELGAIQGQSLQEPPSLVAPSKYHGLNDSVHHMPVTGQEGKVLVVDFPPG